MQNLLDSDKSTGYYNFEYNGNEVGSKGKKFTLSSAPAAPANVPEGDTSDLSIRVESGHSKVGGNLFKLNGIKPLDFTNVPFLRQLRGSAEVSGKLNGDRLNIALGLESPPIHYLHWVNSQIGSTQNMSTFTNWLIVGVAGEAHPFSETNDQSKESMLASHRAHLGVGFLYTYTGVSQKTINDISTSIIKSAPDYHTLKSRAQTADQATPEGRMIYQIATLDVYRPDKDGDYKEFVRGYVKGGLGNSYDPYLTLWVDDFGWYNLTKTHEIGTKRYNNMLAATLAWWLNPADETKYFLRLRYENGYDRSTPLDKRDFIAILFGADLF